MQCAALASQKFTCPVTGTEPAKTVAVSATVVPDATEVTGLPAAAIAKVVAVGSAAPEIICWVNAAAVLALNSAVDVGENAAVMLCVPAANVLVENVAWDAVTVTGAPTDDPSMVN